jgi:hypothetical protein
MPLNWDVPVATPILPKERAMRRLIMTTLCLGLITGTAGALTLNLGPTLCGESEREFAPAPCLEELSFLAGVPSGELNLRVGGNAYGCDSEWASGFEFDLAIVPPGQIIASATLVVHKTGYADDAQGFPYIGAFTYGVAGAPVVVPRDDLDPDTALDILYPPVANVDLFFDVTAAVQELIHEAAATAGFLVAGIFSEAGYHNHIFVGGCANTYPPRLEIVYNAPVAAERASWSSLKALYR